MQKRPVKITFQRMKEPSAVEISLNEVLSKENNLNIVFEQNDPKLETDAEYIASYRLV